MLNYSYPEPKYYFLNIRENRELLHHIHAFVLSKAFEDEFNKFSYNVNEIVSLLPWANFIEFKVNFLYSIVVTIDKIILGNIYSYKYSNRLNEGLVLLSNGTFHHGISIDRYYVQSLFDIIAKHFDVQQVNGQNENYYNYDQKDELFIAIHSLLTNSINAFFTDYHQVVYTIIVNIFNAFFQQVGYINPKWYKIELFSPSKPILVFEERTSEF
jgi:hypothetical protein